MELLSETLSPEELSHVYGSFDIVGDIAVIRLTKASEKNAKKIADAVMKVHGNVKTVLAQTSAISGDFRLRRLTYISGENRTRTVHRESGCLFAVDLESCYFSPRLSHERARIASLVQPGETVVNMFAGVGCFSIVIARHVKSAKVYSIDANPEAFRFMTENIRLNRVYAKVIPVLGDARTVIESQLSHNADRVLMPLPEKAFDYLPWAVSALKPSGGWIHVHTFEHAAKTENPAEKAKQKVTEALGKLGTSFEVPFIRVVRSTGPNWWQLVADVHLPPLPQCLRP
jgi:tRNA (guanine37-N1)-methyltransferase